jgi:hypothetical protein
VTHRDAFRFPSPLIKLDVQISRVRLSDRLHHKAHVGDILSYLPNGGDPPVSSYPQSAALRFDAPAPIDPEEAKRSRSSPQDPATHARDRANADSLWLSTRPCHAKSVPDLRGKQGQDYFLWSILGLIVASLLCKRRGMLAAFHLGAA